MTVPSAEESDSFKYSDSQNLAKRSGLRANMKADKLLKALKAHSNPETRKENKNQDENQFSTDETEIHVSSEEQAEIHVSSEEQAETESGGHVTKMRRRRRRKHKTIHGIPTSQNLLQDHLEMKGTDSSNFQNQENQENQDPRDTAEVPSSPEQRPEDGNAASSGEGEVNDIKDSKKPLEKRSLCTDEFSKLGNNKRTSATTPNFKKLHEAHFKKMESIDEYIMRKKKHLKEHSSLNELKLDKKGIVTPVPPRGRLSVPCTPARQQCPQGHSATKMNVRFSAATKDNEHKCSSTKTPARKSPHVTAPGSASKGQAVFRTPKSKATERTSIAVITPFKLMTEATQTPSSSKKPVFDLKASLSRPLNYKPHKGKSKPWGQAKENNSSNERVSRVTFHRKTYKQPHLQTREERWKRQEQERKEKKEKLLEARRNSGVTKAQ